MSEERITVSREALRAELAELKLDLIDLLRMELEKKADQRLVESIDARLATLEREVVRRDGPIMRSLESFEEDVKRLKTDLGDRPELIRRFKAVEEYQREIRSGTFPAPVERRIREIVGEGITKETDAGWTRRERIFAAIGVVILILSFLFTIYVATAGADQPAQPSTTTEGFTQ